MYIYLHKPRSQALRGGGKKEPGTHCLHMCLITATLHRFCISLCASTLTQFEHPRGLIKLMRKQCVQGSFFPPPPNNLGTRLILTYTIE